MDNILSLSYIGIYIILVLSIAFNFVLASRFNKLNERFYSYQSKVEEKIKILKERIEILEENLEEKS